MAIEHQEERDMHGRNRLVITKSRGRLTIRDLKKLPENLVFEMDPLTLEGARIDGQVVLCGAGVGERLGE